MEEHKQTHTGSPIQSHPPQDVACEACHTQVPSSQAQSHESQEYIRYFCGLNCLNDWLSKNQQARDKPSSK